jgi:polysaccharide biosynthesis transport protein
MQDLLNSKFNDERNLSELFITLWAYKLLIAFTCALGIVFGVYYIMNTDKKFRSTAIFKQDQAQSQAFQLSGELGALGRLAGINSGSTKLDTSKEQIFGRIFIEELDTQLSFRTDPYFNTYNPNLVEPAWKSQIKRAIGWKKSKSDIQQIIWQSIVNNYSKSVEFDISENGSSKIMVTHIDPQRAAEIANAIMNKIISSTKNKKDARQDEQLSYLSNTLARALIDLEVSQSNLKEFTLQNSALPLENFTFGSLQLDVLREQFNRTSKLHEAVTTLLQILQNKTTKQEDYLALRKKFPIVDQVEFRRVLGQNEIISSWSWPEASSVEAVLDTLSERKSRLMSQINASQVEAERSSLVLESYAKLEREAKVAEATYTVLIEQVKAQSMAAGYRPDNTAIYEYATESITPFSPKRNFILALGAMLGICLGTALSLVLALRRGVYYSKNSLRIAVQARFTASVKSLLPLRNKSLKKINEILLQKPRPLLRDMAVEIHKSNINQVVVTSSRSKLSSKCAAKALASYMQSKTMKVAIIDFSSKVQKPNIDNETLSMGSFFISEHVDDITVLRTDGDLTSMDFLAQRGFWAQISTLNSTFDLVFLCADNHDSISLLSALEGHKLFHITLARTKNTKSATIAQMISYLPIQGLLDD